MKIKVIILLFPALAVMVAACKKTGVPVVSTLNVSGITRTSAVSGGKILDDGGLKVSGRGICWSDLEHPTITSRKINDRKASMTFILTMTDLLPSTIYYVRAYAFNTEGIGYGDEVSFSTNPVLVATISTTGVSSISQTTAILGGKIIDDGGAEIISKGVCWSLHTNPDISDMYTSDGAGIGDFISNLSGLNPGTAYYARAYAINNLGISYGNEISFTTSPVIPPKLITVVPSLIASTTATSGGNIISDGGGIIIARGVCWSTNPDPTLDQNRTDEGTGIGIFISQLTGLYPGTTYFLRSYATNSAGTAYGNQISFTTFCIAPIQIIPIDFDVLDNGCYSTDDSFTWMFDWSDCPEATSYNIFVKHPNAINPIIDYVTTESEYLFSSKNSWIGNIYRLGWVWKVRAFINGEWGEWSSERKFDVEKLGTDCLPEIINDIDGNEYHKINIGTQVWLKENLKTIRFNDGTEIPMISDNTIWSNRTSSAYCWYNNNISNKSVYGALYNWYTINTGKLCPFGWQVPTDEDWKTLINYLGGADIAGGKLKESGVIHWIIPNIGATDESGFTALPGGFRYSNGSFGRLGDVADFWSSSENSITNAWDYGFDNLHEGINRDNDPKTGGFSVRCIW